MGGKISWAMPVYSCPQPGWHPQNYRLKEHHVFWYDGYYYLISTRVPSDHRFAYGRSKDFCQWEELSPVLNVGLVRPWDDRAVWAPYVFIENGTYYLYYTGVTDEFTQSILLATTTDPADPYSWKIQGMVFQPQHQGTTWENGKWADCRDPTVLKVGNLYYLYYTGQDVDGAIVGLATATSPLGPWADWGTILPPMTSGILESTTVVQYDKVYYLINWYPGQSAVFRAGAGPGGPWSDSHLLAPGWAHEIWQGQDGDWYISYLTDYSVTISHLTWDTFFDPPRPWIALTVSHYLLPMLTKSGP